MTPDALPRDSLHHFPHPNAPTLHLEAGAFGMSVRSGRHARVASMLVTRPIQEDRMSNTSTEGGQEPRTGQDAGQAQEAPANGTPGQEPGSQATDQAPNAPADVTTMTEAELRTYAAKVAKDAKEAREEAARYRTRATTAETRNAEYQRQNETAEQAAQREATERQERLDALERENRDLKVGTAVRAAATEAKAFNPNLVTDMLQAKVTLGEDGKPTNLDDLLKDLRKSDPYLFRRQANQDAGEGQGEGGSPGQSMNDRIRAARQGIR